MSAPKNIGHAGSGRMANISLYDNEFPLLRVNGLYAALTSGDGDCLFHSLSDQVCHPFPLALGFALLHNFSRLHLILGDASLLKGV